MISRMIRFALFAISAMILIPLACRAQDEIPTAVTNQNRSGELPFSTRIGTDVEGVDVSSGNLIVNIPITGVRGRGLNYSFSLRYDARFLVVGTRVSPTTGLFYQIWNIAQDQYLGQGPFPIAWLTSTPTVTNGETQIVCNADFGLAATLHMSYIYRDPNGVKHPLAFQWDDGSQGVCGGILDGPGPDLTGEGMLTSPAGFTPPDVLLSDGTITGNTNATDSNGNQVALTAGGTDTLGRVIVTQQNIGTTQTLYKVYDSNGVLQTYTVNFTNINIVTHFNLQGRWGPIAEVNEPRQVVSSIVLPNGRSYQFQYENGGYGALTRIDLPSGAYITYQWATMVDSALAYRSFRYVSNRTLNVDGQTFPWNISMSGSTHAITTTVTDPVGNQSVYNVADGTVLTAKVFQGAASATPLRRYDLTYTADADPQYLENSTNDPTYESQNVATRLISISTTLDNGLVSKKEFDYDSFNYTYHTCITYPCAGGNPTTFSTSRGNVTEIREFDWGNGAPGALVRRTRKGYLHDSNSAYVNANIVSKIVRELICTPSATCSLSNPTDASARTDIEFDNYVAGDNALIATTGAPRHSSNYSSSETTRGNATRVNRWRNTDGALLTTTYTYDDLGNIRAIKDPRGNTTSWSYTDSWANGACPPPGNSQAYVSQVTNALNQNIQVVHYPCTGLVQAHKDQNDINASRAGVTYIYDLFGRMTQKNLPDGGQASNSYNDVPPLSVAATTKITASVNLTSTSLLDGLGRPKQGQLTSDPQGFVYTDTTYDALGRKATASNPYRSTSEPTYGITTFNFDALGRTTKVIPPDGTTSSNNVVTAYSGNSTTVTDQVGKQRRSFTDGLGRLIEVDEPTGGAGATAGTGWAAVSGTEQSIAGSAVRPGSGTVTISGSEDSFDTTQCYSYDLDTGNCTQWQTTTTWDNGGVTITVNGFAASTSYGQVDTAATVASHLLTALNVASSPVNATLSGTVITLTAKAAGAATNYPLSTAVTYDTFDFSYPSFLASPSGSALTGGADATTVYDSGSVWVTVNGFQALVSYGQGSTPTPLATALANLFNTNSASPVTASLSGTTLNLTARQTGAATNYSLSKGSSTSQPSTFSQPSFTVSVSGSLFTNGADADGSLSTPAVTLYTYDILNNLTCVVQKGTDTTAFTTCAAAPAAWRPRSFTYNSLSQLLTATNPESGAITYTYDSNGNLLTKIAPAPNQTGAATVTTCFGNWNGTSCDGAGYDSLNRLTQKSYSDGTTPTAGFSYDQTFTWGINIGNPIGRLTTVGMLSGGAYVDSDLFSYDATGRMILHKQCVPACQTGSASAFPANYTYDLAGDITSYTNGVGVTFNQTFDAAARFKQLTSSLADAQHPGTLATVDASVGYYPSGAIHKMTLANGYTQTTAYNNRLQPCRIDYNYGNVALNSCADATPASSIEDFNYDFGVGTANNGNIASWTATGWLQFNRRYTYDALNRLATMSDTNSTQPCKGLSWTYDIWGNRTDQNVTSGSCTTSHVGVNAQNRLSGAPYAYDAAGNMTNDGNHTYTYDAENRLIRVDGTPGTCSTATACYTYDANGRRVERALGAAGKIDYIYDLAGHVVAEYYVGYSNYTGWGVGYVYVNGQMIAEYKNSTTYTAHNDHLGSARLFTDVTAFYVTDCYDFYPFGEASVPSTPCSSGASAPSHVSTTHQFTGKERDSESGLDNFGARYDSSAIGRFASPDPRGVMPKHLMLPQSLNLYEYAADNPLRYIDPNGFDPAEVIKGLSHISFQLQEVWQRPLEDYVTNGKIENLTSRSAANSAQGGGEAIAGGGIVAVGIYALLAASGPVGWVGGGVGIVGGATLGGSGIHGMRKSAKELAAELPEMLKIYKFEKEVEDVVSKINPMSVREYTMDELWLALAETDTIHKTGLLPQRLDDQAAGASAIIRAEIDRRNKEKEEEDKRRKKCEASGVCLI